MGFSNAEWCRTMYDLYRNTAFSILTNDKTEKWVIPIYGALIMLLLLSLIINFRDTINAIYNQITSVYAHSSNYTFQVYEVTLSQQELPFLFSRVWIALYLLIMLLEYLLSFAGNDISQPLPSAFCYIFQRCCIVSNSHGCLPVCF